MTPIIAFVFLVVACIATKAQGLSVSPASGGGSTQSFLFTFNVSSPGTVLNVLMNNGLDGRNACFIAFVPTSNVPPQQATGALYLVADDGSTLGSSANIGYNTLPTGTLQNSQCSIALASSTFTVSGNTFELGLAISFKSLFAGNKIVYMATHQAAPTSWSTLGVWSVLSSTSMVTSMSAARSTAVPNQAYTFSFTDNSGAGVLLTVDVLVNSSFDSAHACYLAYNMPSSADPRSGILYLVRDSGTTGDPNNLYIGQMTISNGSSSGSIQNSQCAISSASSRPLDPR